MLAWRGWKRSSLGKLADLTSSAVVDSSTRDFSMAGDGHAQEGDGPRERACGRSRKGVPSLWRRKKGSGRRRRRPFESRLLICGWRAAVGMMGGCEWTGEPLVVTMGWKPGDGDYCFFLGTLGFLYFLECGGCASWR